MSLFSINVCCNVATLGFINFAPYVVNAGVYGMAWARAEDSRICVGFLVLLMVVDEDGMDAAFMDEDATGAA